ncbi:GAF domain-containing protein [candidate division KSB1 bacterium]|nr:GAF domain-containing protein [candidate division KSB1 bacterium]
MTQEINELSRISVLTRIAKAITENADIVRIFEIAIQKIRHYCFCDAIYVVYNNPMSKSFYLTPALNLDKLLEPKEVSVYYQQTILARIVDDNTSILCSDLSKFEMLLEGDKHFFPHQTGSFLAVPISCEKKLMAFFLLINAQQNSFDENDQLFVEDVANLLALAMERADLQRNMLRFQRDKNRWHELYTSLMENISEPVALINPAYDIIYQTNRAFQNLMGQSAEMLYGTKISAIHPVTPLLQLLENSNGETYFTFNSVQFELPDHKKVNTDIHLFPIEEDGVPLFLALYKEERANAPAFENGNELQYLNLLFTQLLAAPVDQNLKAILENFLYQTAEIFQYRYLTLHLYENLKANLELMIAHRFPKLNQNAYDRPWIISINEGPFLNVLDSQRPLLIEDIEQNEQYNPWRPIAEKLNYRSLAIFPLIFNQEKSGLISFFYSQPRKFNQAEMNLYQQLVLFLNLFIRNHQLKEEANKFSKQVEITHRITNSINSTLDLTEIVRIVISEISHIIKFDYANITLFDETGENIQVFTIVSKLAGKEIKTGVWSPFDGQELGWLRNLNMTDDSNKLFATEITTLEQNCPSKINLLLFSRAKYLGTFTISSLNAYQFNEEHRQFLNQIIAPWAAAIENARLFENVNRNLAEFTALADISKSISTSLDLHHVFNQIVRAAALALEAKVCTIRLVDNEEHLKTAAPVPAFCDEERAPRELEVTIEQILRELKPDFWQSLTPVYVNNLVQKFPQLKSYQSFLAMPVVFGGKAIACLSLFWEENRNSWHRELKLISIIANQAANAIQNARLYQETVRNSEKLKSVNEELESFVYTVSHDLKSPIVAIQGFASIFLQDYANKIEPDAIHYVERIQANANQMEKLIRDLLELSRIGRVVNPFETVDVALVLAEAQTELIFQIQEKQIEVVIQPDFPKIRADRNRLVQVFTNLISNAVKYIGHPEKPRIEIGWNETDDTFIFYIKDNGIGIEKKYHEKIFGLFQILNPDPDKTKSGTGVGLTIVKRIVKNHGGKIWLESVPGKGSTFYFSIPKHTQEN